jgi:hypothetical protein
MITYHTVVRLSSEAVIFSKKINVFTPTVLRKAKKSAFLPKKQRMQAEKKI